MILSWQQQWTLWVVVQGYFQCFTHLRDLKFLGLLQLAGQ